MELEWVRRSLVGAGTVSVLVGIVVSWVYRYMENLPSAQLCNLLCVSYASILKKLNIEVNRTCVFCVAFVRCWDHKPKNYDSSVRRENVNPIQINFSHCYLVSIHSSITSIIEICVRWAVG